MYNTFIEGKEFCESFVNNADKLLVHSPDNEKLILVIDKNIWILDENNQELRFTFGTLVHHFDEELGDNMTTMFSIIVPTLRFNLIVGSFKASIH